MNLALSRAVVESPEGIENHAGVVVGVANGRLRILTRQGTLLSDVEATSVEAAGTGRWVVETSVGTFTVTREKSGCGCG